jgi:hypothetical protein
MYLQDYIDIPHSLLRQWPGSVWFIRQHTADLGHEATYPWVVRQQAAELGHCVPAVSSVPCICHLLEQAFHLRVIFLCIPRCCKHKQRAAKPYDQLHVWL